LREVIFSHAFTAKVKKIMKNPAPLINWRWIDFSEGDGKIDAEGAVVDLEGSRIHSQRARRSRSTFERRWIGSPLRDDDK
jgi:hypothetical protein